MQQHMIDSGDPPATIVEQEPGFNYYALDRDTADYVRNLTGEIRTRGQRMCTELIAIGHDLINVKDALPHGQFGRWLTAEFGWSERTARNYMALAEAFGHLNSATLADSEPTALYALAANTVPDEVRERFIAQAGAGQPIRHKEVREKLGTSPRAKADPTGIELVAEIVRLMVDAYDGRGVRTKAGFGRAVKSNLIAQEIEAYDEDDRHEIADIVAAFAEACLDAVESVRGA